MEYVRKKSSKSKNYQKSKIAKLWIPELGNAESSRTDFNFLKAYSPLHNIDSNKSHPPLLITNSENDPRTDPSHARLMYSELVRQTATSDKPQGPFYLLTNMNMGHVTNSRSEGAHRIASSLAFAWENTRPGVPTK